MGVQPTVHSPRAKPGGGREPRAPGANRCDPDVPPWSPPRSPTPPATEAAPSAPPLAGLPGVPAPALAAAAALGGLSLAARRSLALAGRRSQDGRGASGSCGGLEAEAEPKPNHSRISGLRSPAPGCSSVPATAMRGSMHGWEKPPPSWFPRPPSPSLPPPPWRSRRRRRRRRNPSPSPSAAARRSEWGAAACPAQKAGLVPAGAPAEAEGAWGPLLPARWGGQHPGSAAGPEGRGAARGPRAWHLCRSTQPGCSSCSCPASSERGGDGSVVGHPRSCGNWGHPLPCPDLPNRGRAETAPMAPKCECSLFSAPICEADAPWLFPWFSCPPAHRPRRVLSLLWETALGLCKQAGWWFFLRALYRPSVVALCRLLVTRAHKGLICLKLCYRRKLYGCTLVPKAFVASCFFETLWISLMSFFFFGLGDQTHRN